MSTSPMRSIIRILADSSLVERIALDHENNNVRIFYKETHKNVESIKEVVSVLNYYFEKEFRKKDALILVDKKEKVILKIKKEYHLNTYSSTLFDVYRIDIHDPVTSDHKYYDPTNEIIEIELTCVEHAKDVIFADLRKKSSVKKCVIEFNYMNLKDPDYRNQYLAPLKQLPKTISRNIDISLVRLSPEDDLDEINKTLEFINGVAGERCLSVYYNDNLPLIERALESKADKLFLTVDFQGLEDEKVIEQLHAMVKEHPKSQNIFIIQYNIDKDNAKMIGETSNTLKFSGREAIKRG